MNIVEITDINALVNDPLYQQGVDDTSLLMQLTNMVSIAGEGLNSVKAGLKACFETAIGKPLHKVYSAEISATNKVFCVIVEKEGTPKTAQNFLSICQRGHLPEGNVINPAFCYAMHKLLVDNSYQKFVNTVPAVSVRRDTYIAFEMFSGVLQAVTSAPLGNSMLVTYDVHPELLPDNPDDQFFTDQYLDFENYQNNMTPNDIDFMSGVATGNLG
jgi:hypothetical protein